MHDLIYIFYSMYYIYIYTLLYILHSILYILYNHLGILRIIYAFYMDHTRAEAPYLSIPLNVVLELNPGAVTCTEKVIYMNI